MYVICINKIVLRISVWCHCDKHPMQTCAYVNIFYRHLEVMICFNEPSINIIEDQGSIVILIIINNQSSTDIIFNVNVITANGTAIGE